MVLLSKQRFTVAELQTIDTLIKGKKLTEDQKSLSEDIQTKVNYDLLMMRYAAQEQYCCCDEDEKSEHMQHIKNVLASVLKKE